MTRRTIALATSIALLAGGGCSAKKSDSAPPPGDVRGDVQLLSLQTWLGQLDPVQESDADGGVHHYGGLATLSSYFAADRAAVPNTLLVMSSDSFGASPPLSSQFGDEPAVQAMNFLGARADTLGNHNFNAGVPALRHLIEASGYPYVTTNMDQAVSELGPSVRAPYVIIAAGGVQVALLGITSPQAPAHALPGRFGSITIREPIAAANAAAHDARAAGASVVVALTDLETIDVNAAGEHVGPLIDFAKGVLGVDVVLGYKAQAQATPRYGDVTVVEHAWKGRTYGRTKIHVEAGRVASVTAEVVAPDAAAVTPDANAEALLAPYRAQLAQQLDRKVTEASSLFATDGTERAREAPIGDLIADALLEQYRAAGAQIAVVNAGGIRQSLPSSYAPRDASLRRPQAGYAPGPPWDVVAGDVFNVLPFGNQCVVRPITGATLWAMLEASVFYAPDPNKGFLQIAGFSFSYRESAAPGARVVSVTLDGGDAIARDDKRSFILVDNNFIDAGGDGYSMLVDPQPAPQLEVMADVLLHFLESRPRIDPAPSTRITRLP